MRSNVEKNLIGRKRARAAFVQIHLKGFRSHETSAAHDQFGAARAVNFQVLGDLAFYHLALATANRRHIDSDGTGHRAKKLTRCHPWIFPRITKKTDYPHKRRIKREVDAWLGHCGAMKGARLRGDDRLLGAEVALECDERSLVIRGAWNNKRIVVPRNSKDRRGEGTKRFIKLIIVIPRFTKIEMTHDLHGELLHQLLWRRHVLQP